MQQATVINSTDKDIAILITIDLMRNSVDFPDAIHDVILHALNYSNLLISFLTIALWREAPPLLRRLQQSGEAFQAYSLELLVAKSWTI